MRTKKLFTRPVGLFFCWFIQYRCHFIGEIQSLFLLGYIRVHWWTCYDAFSLYLRGFQSFDTRVHPHLLHAVEMSLSLWWVKKWALRWIAIRLRPVLKLSLWGLIDVEFMIKRLHSRVTIEFHTFRRAGSAEDAWKLGDVLVLNLVSG